MSLEWRFRRRPGGKGALRFVTVTRRWSVRSSTRLSFRVVKRRRLDALARSRRPVEGEIRLSSPRVVSRAPGRRGA
eukprot:14413965-Alexandrium_andersonii.AAC.1